jgi:hypothetical protein
VTGPIPLECAPYAEEWSALLDGELAPAREAELRAHLDGCARCQAKLASLARVDVLLAGLPVAEANGDLYARLRARIDASEARDAAPRLVPPRRRARSLAIAAAAVAAAAALALYLALPRPRGEIAPPPEPRIAKAPEPAPEVTKVPEPTQIAKAPAPAPVAEPRAVTPPAPEPARDPEFDALPADELALGMDLDTAKDLPVIANLELLERLVALEEGRG